MANILLLWPMVATACLTLAGVHLFIWLRDRRMHANLLFSLKAASLAAFAGFEVAMLQASSVAEFVRLHHAWHVSAFFLILFMILFVWTYLRAGRFWLAATVIALRVLVLGIMFASGETFNYQEIRGLLTYDLFGVAVTVADGVPRTLARIGDVSLFLFLVYAVDAAVTGWRRGAVQERRRALMVGGGVALCVGVSLVNVYLVHTARVQAPYFITFAFLPIVLAMGYELSHDLVRAGLLARELRDSEARLSLAADAAGMGLWGLDTQTNRFWLTTKTRELFQFAADEAVTWERFMKLVHPDDRDLVRQSLEQIMKGGDETHLEYRVRRPDGQTRWMYSRGRSSEPGAAAPGSVMGVTMDVTAHKEVELEAEGHRAEVEHLSRVALLGELSGAIAHELNQPLTAILSNAQAAQRFMANDQVDLEELREILADIVADDRRAGEVIHRLRLLLKKGEPQNQWLDLNEVTEDVLRLMRSDLLNNGITVHADFAPDLPDVLADRVQIQQVLLNLIMNACEAMNGAIRGEKQLAVHTEWTGNGQVGVAVVDQGHGLSEEAQERMFDPFYTTKATGMGLGLKVCHTIVETHGGRLTGENNAERGATFRFTLPAAAKTANSNQGSFGEP